MSKPVAQKINETPSRLREQVEACLKDIAANVQAIAVDVKAIKLVKTVSLDVSLKDSKSKPLLLYVHINSLKIIQKHSKRLINELEKRLKVSVFITCKRNIQSRWIKPHKSQMRPRNRTLTAVHDALLEEICAPCNIIGRRLRVRVDGTQVHKVILDKSEESFLQDRVQLICEVYRKLTCKTIQIQFTNEPVYYVLQKKVQK